MTTALSQLPGGQQIGYATSGSVTVSTPIYDGKQTWNASGVTFTAVRLNVADTASAAASLLLDLQKGGVSQFSVRKDGNVTSNVYVANGGYQVIGSGYLLFNGRAQLLSPADGVYQFSKNTGTQLTVAALPASPGDGARAFVTDANATTFGSVVAGGGTNHMPVYYDGGASAWKIG